MKRIILILLSFTAFTSCHEDDDIQETQHKAFIDNQLFTDAESDKFEIIEMSSKSKLLKIVLSYGGGCGNVSATIVDSGEVYGSDPVQRNVRIVFTDDEMCEALVRKDFLFDITVLQVENEDQVLLKFQKSDFTYMYEY